MPVRPRPSATEKLAAFPRCCGALLNFHPAPAPSPTSLPPGEAHFGEATLHTLRSRCKTLPHRNKAPRSWDPAGLPPENTRKRGAHRRAVASLGDGLPSSTARTLSYRLGVFLEPEPPGERAAPMLQPRRPHPGCQISLA